MSTRPARLRSASAAAALTLLLGTWLFSLAGHLGRLDWRLDLASHFRPHYALAAALALLACAALRRRRAAALAAALLLLELAQLAPYWFASPGQAGAPAVRLAHFNVLTENPRKAEVTAWLADAGADLVLVEEVDPAWAAALAGVPGHALALAAPRADNFGLALLVRQDASDMVVQTWLEELVPGIPAVAAELAVDGRRLAVLGVHTLPPVSAAYAARRDAQLAAAADWARRQREAGRLPVILGDLNATPWSAPLRRLVADADLVDSQRGFGLQASWPAGPLWPQLALDHCLHDPALVTTARALGPALGSDHLPLRVDLAWARGRD